MRMGMPYHSYRKGCGWVHYPVADAAIDWCDGDQFKTVRQDAQRTRRKRNPDTVMG